MCGAMLEPARKATAPRATAVSEAARPVENRAPETQTAVAAPPKPPEKIQSRPPVEPLPPPKVSEPVPPIGGPSLLGLDSPNVDVLRGQTFAGLDSYGESESKSKGTRVFLLLLLLAALGGGFWWTYTNYLSVTDGRKSTTSPVAANPAEDDSASSTAKSVPAAEQENLPLRSTPRVQAPLVTPEPPGKKSAAQVQPGAGDTATTSTHQVSATRLSAAPPVADNGDALFRQGERYLYGRGGAAEDCTNALRYLKLASDKQNAKARSAMGTMYATGHCVSRDLPSAYRWFALALRVDPNNTVLEKNLSGVWNQMTPPERQLATKSQ